MSRENFPPRQSLSGALLHHRGVHLEVLRFYYRAIGVAQVVAGPVLGEVVGQGALPGVIEACECGLGGTEIFAEESDSLGRRKRIIEK